MVACIVLAAGLSSRFGSPKPLARIGSKTVIELIQEKLLSTGLSEIIFVLGHEATMIAPLLTCGPRIKYVVNTNYALGQTSSFKTGLKSVSPGSAGIMLLPVDMPAVSPDTIDELIHIFIQRAPHILIPACQGRNGHPPIFSMQLKEELMGLGDDEPLSNIIHRHKNEILKIAVNDPGVISSFNTPEELKQILSLFS